MSTSALTQAEAYGIFTYSFEVIGPKSITVPVVITISGSLSQATKGGSLASVEIVPNQGYETGLQYGCGYGAPVKLCGAYSTSITVNVLSTKHANAAYANAVTLESDNQIYGGTATGSVTTSVAIAPGFTGGASYYIVQSPGVGNTATSTTSSRNP
jgi:hypothetical protein